jgi:hypothetical protein
MVSFRLIGFLHACLNNLSFNHFSECPMQLIFPPRNRTKFMIAIALLALCPTLVTSPAHASTNSGIDTPSGESTLPFAVEGVQGMTLVTQSPTTGPVYVGIGTANPAEPLDILASTTAQVLRIMGSNAANDNTQMIFAGHKDGNLWFVGTDVDQGGSTGDFEFYNAGNAGGTAGTKLTVLGNGDVGIGTTSPAFKLDVTGDIHASGWLRTGSGVVFPDGTTQTTAATAAWTGDYIVASGGLNACSQGNPFTGGCSCPAGSSAASGVSGFGFHNSPWDTLYIHVTCYK